jgi:hypothetical protein
MLVSNVCYAEIITNLSHVSRGVGVLCSEDGTNTINPLSSTSNLKLLVELRALSQVSLLVKVWHSKDIGSSFRCSPNQAWRVELLESVLSQVFAEEIFDRNPNIGDCLTDWCSLVHSRIVEMCGQTSKRCTFRDA